MALLLCGVACGASILWSAFRDRDAFRREKGNLALLGAMEAAIYFCATLGISDFLLNTLLFRRLRLAGDEKLPGTLVTCGLTPGAVMAFSYLRSEEPVELLTLVPCAAAIMLGCVCGARIVGGLDGAKIRRIMGFALIGSMCALILRIIVGRGAAGAAVGLSAPRLAVAVAFSFFWGVVNMIGVPMKPAGTAVFLLLGMSPLATLTMIIVVGSIGPLGGALSIFRSGRYHKKSACAAVLSGTAGAVLGTLFTISISAALLNILLLLVMLIAIISMFR